MLNGTIYIVTDTPNKIPDRSLLTSTGCLIKNGPVEEAKRVPGDKEMRIIDPDEARRLFGTSAERLDGVSVRMPLSRSSRLLTCASVVCERPQTIVRATSSWQKSDPLNRN